MVKQQMGNQSSNPKTAMPQFLSRRISEGGFILILTIALFILLSLLTYQVTDPGLSHNTPYEAQIGNAGGAVGAYLADALYFTFGYFAYLLPFCFGFLGWKMLRDHQTFQAVNRVIVTLRGVGLILMLGGGCGLLNLELPGNTQMNIQHAGGYVGKTISAVLNSALNIQGATLVLLAFLLIGVTWLTGLSWINAIEMIGYYTLLSIRLTVRLSKIVFNFLSTFISRMQSIEKNKVNQTIERPSLIKTNKERPQPVITPFPMKATEKPVALKGLKEVKEVKVLRETSPPKSTVTGKLPSLSLLSKGAPGEPMGGHTHQELETLSRDVEQHLLDFGIQADVVAVHPGPVITRFELQLAAGIKVSKLSALAKDLARSLSVTSVRVVEIIPGKTVVGIELPNLNRAMVCLSDVLSADVYQQAHSPLTLALGVDIAGHPMVVDLAKMPHLLVAGTTGSGKSVGINAMILSLLFKATPEQVRLILVDPKMLELSVYDDIPHLLTPVVTDMKEAASALRWCVNEMERRYRLMASLGVRNLAGYNAKVAEAAERGEVLSDPLWKPTDSMDTTAPALKALPYVVVVIDELADMMMVVGKKVEQLIARIAQKARAAGIHLILATQRPSVDVLTGLIKSNIPTRISFQVSSKIDSRTILDQQGAEQLLGHGDMLFLAPGTGAPLRVHGAFVDDKEVHRIADDWRARGQPDYIEEITLTAGDGIEGGLGEDGQMTEDVDPLYDQAVEFVLQTRKASISSVQRRLKIGYNRAARLIEEMERTGIVGPLEGGFRDVLVSSSEENL